MLSAIIDFILNIDQHLQVLAANYGLWIYLILFIIIFCETGLVVTPLLPGDSLLFAAGGLAAIGEMNVHFMVVILVIAAIIGDATNFHIGKHFGHRLFDNPDSKIFKRIYLENTHAFYTKHGGKTIILARFVPIVRTFAPFVAGMSNMNYTQFSRYNVIGALLWVPIFSYLGYFFANIPIVKENLSLVLIDIILLSDLPGIIEIIRHRRNAKKIS